MLPPMDGYDAKPIDVAIADMSGVLRPHLSIIDGTVGMEGLGPSAGKPKATGSDCGRDGTRSQPTPSPAD